MNLPLLTSVFKSSREYSTLSEAIRSSLATGRCRPITATGLSDGAADIFLPALVGDFADQCILILSPEEKDAAAAAALLSGLGIRAMHYPARDYIQKNRCRI